ncbi:TPA: hypothetical protein SLO57_005008 [Klebsiella pneumoniae]|nr:hypothetical protein [Klebsiella pneumoniae]
MGYAAIVTSEMFGIASTLDRPTQHDLEMQRLLSMKKELSFDEKTELDKINKRLDRLGFRFFYPDDEYSRYLRLRREALVQKYNTEDSKSIAGSVLNMSLEEREALSRRLLASMVENEDEEENK